MKRNLTFWRKIYRKIAIILTSSYTLIIIFVLERIESDKHRIVAYKNRA